MAAAFLWWPLLSWNDEEWLGFYEGVNKKGSKKKGRIVQQDEFYLLSNLLNLLTASDFNPLFLGL